MDDAPDQPSTSKGHQAAEGEREEARKMSLTERLQTDRVEVHDLSELGKVLQESLDEVKAEREAGEKKSKAGK
ncbi:MAG: hypothetical protein ABIJ09_17505 [Pseudomonadota bacterium]